MKLNKIALFFKNTFCYQTQRLFDTFLNLKKTFKQKNIVDKIESYLLKQKKN